LALIEGCKHSLEITVPVEEVEQETGRVVGDFQKKARLPGFRPGKAPASLIRKQFKSEVRKQVLENLIPRYLDRRLKEEELHVVSQPDISKLKFDDGEPLEFTAEFEVAPEFQIGEYKGLTVTYNEPSVSEQDVDKRIEEIRERKADFVNVDPRPIEDGDYALVSLESLAGTGEKPVKHDEIMLHIGAEDTVAAFTENLLGASPGDTKTFDVTYPEEYAQEKLAGKTVSFEAVVKGIRKKELPELNDEFAKDLGDFQTLDELRDAIRKSMLAERTHAAQDRAKGQLADALADAHDFPVPESYIDRQIRNRTEQRLRALAAEGVDISKFNPDWEKVKEAQRDSAVREVKASLLLGKVSERESIYATKDEVDREVERAARQQREPVAAVRLRYEKDGTLDRIASHIQTQKTLNFLFEHATKVAGEEPSDEAGETAEVEEKAGE
jgi:trigger factor